NGIEAQKKYPIILGVSTSRGPVPSRPHPANQDRDMQVHKKPNVKPAEFDELFPSHPHTLTAEKAADLLQSRVIHSFEAAVDQGMQPNEALSTIVSWVALELARVELDRSGGPSSEP